MHELSHSEFDPEGDYKEKWRRDRKVSYLNRLAASIGYNPTITKKTKRLMGIPYGSEEETKNIYESKKHKKHPHVKVSGQSEENYTERGGIEGKKSNPPSSSSSGEEWLEQTIHTIKDVILERTAGRPAPIRHVGHRGSTARAGARAGLPRRGLTRRKPEYYLKQQRQRARRQAVSPRGSLSALRRHYTR